jgi:signal transduction histidine kinase
VCLKVVDNGIGMPYEILGKVFSVDRSKVAPGTSGELGSGIGLNVCYDFVLLNKGQIEIDSKVDIGTTVTIWLPMEDPSL